MAAPTTDRPALSRRICADVQLYPSLPPHTGCGEDFEAHRIRHRCYWHRRAIAPFAGERCVCPCGITRPTPKEETP